MERTVKRARAPRRWLPIVCLALGLLVLALTAAYLLGGVGVRRLSVRSHGDTVELRLHYFAPTGGYSVFALDEDAGEYVSDGERPYDGSLGRYRIVIRLGDTERAPAFMTAFPFGEAVELRGTPVPMKARIACPDDHGFWLYIGCDSPMAVSEVEYEPLDSIGGVLSVPIVLSEE